MSAKTDNEIRTEDDIRAALAPRLSAAKTRQEKTREAATLLFFGHGIYPSAKTVYGYTQHGSMTDINRDLREFWSDLREKTRVKIDAPMLPDAVVNQFSEALAQVWALSTTQASAVLDGERQEAEKDVAHARSEAAEQVAQARSEAKEAERMSGIAEDRAEASERELRQEREKRETAERRVEAQAAEIDGLGSSLAKWQAQAEAEAQARRDAEERFSRDLEAERAARERDTERMEGENRFAMMQIESARTVGRDLKERLESEQNRHEAEIAIYRQRVSHADEALGTVRLELAEARGRFSELHERLKALSKDRVRGVAKPAVRRRSLR